MDKQNPMRFFEEMLGGSSLDKSVGGKKAVKYDRAWILLARVHTNLYLAVESKTSPPAPVMLLRLMRDEILDI